MADEARAGLNILHVLRAPVGGLFRHVVDLATGQAARGHRIGLIADSASGGPQSDAMLEDLAPVLALGLTRVPMSRQFGTRDLPAAAHVARMRGSRVTPAPSASIRRMAGACTIDGARRRVSSISRPSGR